MPDFKLTPEQQAIVDYTAEHNETSVLISALAGSAKTSTLELLRHPPGQTTLALAFNVLAKKELEAKLPSSIIVKTLNGLGHSAWAKVPRNRLTLDTGKIYSIVKASGTEHVWRECIAALNVARTAGLVPKGVSAPSRPLLEDTVENWLDLFDQYDVDLPVSALPELRNMLKESIRQAFVGNIDFNDQLYMSACFYGGFPHFHTVLVDEAQDLSSINHRMLAMIKPKRIIAVGDSKQSIYAFRGARPESMSELAEAWSMEKLPLTTCFRCARSVVKLAQDQRVPEMRPWDQSPEGSVEYWDSWSAQDILRASPATIICRNNAPLFTLAYILLSERIPVKVLGSDIGKNLQTCLARAVGERCPKTLPIRQVQGKLNAWHTKELEKAKAKEKPGLANRAKDRFDSLNAIIKGSGAATYGELLREITSMFEDKPASITLTTGHKAKGREWDTVFHLDPWRIPSKYAKQASREGNPHVLTQELNLRYVITTRAKKKLIHIDLQDERQD